MSEHPKTAEFESLLINNPRFADIEAYISRFNPIRVMKMESMEIRHSAILGWLLDPQGSHGLGDDFLKAFLSEALSGRDGADPVSALDVLREDFSTARIKVEKQSIDLFVQLERTGSDWVFVIENKYHSGLHSDQLDRYFKKTKNAFGKSTKICGVLLSLHDTPTDDERYAPINYSDVFRLIEDVVERQPTTPEVSTFIRHYINILKEAASMSEEAKDIQKIARELYRENRAVIDFIVEHGSDTDFSAATELLLDGDPPDSHSGEMVTINGSDYEYGGASTTQFDFLPESWANALYSGPDEIEVFFAGCEDWWMGYPLVVWLELQTDAEGQSGRVALYAEVGRVSMHSARVDLLDRVQAAADENKKLKIKFRKDVRQEGKKYSKFFYDNFQEVSDVHDAEVIADAMKKLLKRFKPEFDAVGEKLEGAYELGEVVKS